MSNEKPESDEVAPWAAHLITLLTERNGNPILMSLPFDLDKSYQPTVYFLREEVYAGRHVLIAKVLDIDPESAQGVMRELINNHLNSHPLAEDMYIAIPTDNSKEILPYEYGLPSAA